MRNWKLEMALLLFVGVAATPLMARAVTRARATQPEVRALRDGESRYRPGDPRAPNVRSLLDGESRYRPGEPIALTVAR